MSMRLEEPIGPSTLELPYPIYLRGEVITGFGRGSSELNIPTANLPSETAESQSELETGIYYGYAVVEGVDTSVQGMVMSYGWNPYYKNEKRAMACFQTAGMMKGSACSTGVCGHVLWKNAEDRDLGVYQARTVIHDSSSANR